MTMNRRQTANSNATPEFGIFPAFSHFRGDLSQLVDMFALRPSSCRRWREMFALHPFVSAMSAMMIKLCPLCALSIRYASLCPLIYLLTRQMLHSIHFRIISASIRGIVNCLILFLFIHQVESTSRCPAPSAKILKICVAMLLICIAKA